MRYFLILFFITPAYAQTDLRPLFKQAASQEGISAPLLSALCWVESSHRSVIRILDGSSPSIGVCQVKLRTARSVGFTGTAKELLKPEINIFIAAKYLHYQLERYNQNWKMAVTAYNRGKFKGRLNNHYVIQVLLAMSEGR